MESRPQSESAPSPGSGNNNNFSIADQAREEVRGQNTLRDAILTHDPVNLVFEGGGIKGILYTGILLQLKERNLLKNVRNVAGSSAGGIVAFALALGYTPDEVYKRMAELDFKTLQDTKTYTKALNVAGKVASSVAAAGVVKFATNTSTVVAAATQAASFLNGDNAPVALGEVAGLFVNNYLWEGEGLIKLAKDLIKEKGFDPEMTFLEHHNLLEEARSEQARIEKALIIEGKSEDLDDKYKKALLFKDLFLTGTRIDEIDRSSVTFGWKETPTVRMFDGFRATAGFPFAYKPHQITIDDGHGSHNTYHYTDGGVINNYPMDIFDCSRQDNPDFFAAGAELIKVGAGGNRNSLTSERYINPCTLGFKVDDAKECESLLIAKNLVTQRGNSPRLTEMLNTLMYNSNAGVGTYYKYNTIQGSDLKLKTLDFALSPLEKLALIYSGHAAALDYFNKKENNFSARADQPVNENVKLFTSLAKNLIFISNKLKELGTYSMMGHWQYTPAINEIELKISKIIHSLKDINPKLAVDVAVVIHGQMEASWASISYFEYKRKPWRVLQEKLTCTVNDVAQAPVVSSKEKSNVAKFGAPGIFGAGAGILAMSVLALPAAVLVGAGAAVVGIGYTLLSGKKKTDSAESQNNAAVPASAASQVNAAAPAASQDNTATGERLEHFRLMKFKKCLSNNDYELAMKQVSKATDVGILDDMSKQLQAKKLTFISRVHSRFDGEIPEGVKELEKALVAKLTLMNEAAQLIKPTQPM